MRNATLLIPLLVTMAPRLLAQGPQTLIENDQVRVLKAVDKPHNKGAIHEHKLNRVMVYLTPGRQEITPQGGKTAVREFKAGEVTWSPASGMHESEVTSDAPLTIIELEVKKPGDPAKAVKNKLDPVKILPNHYRVEFENSQVRVVRVKIGAHQKVALHEHVLNRVVVYLTDQKGTMTTEDGKTDTAQHKAGEASWGTPTRHREENLLDTPFEAVVVEFKN